MKPLPPTEADIRELMDTSKYSEPWDVRLRVPLPREVAIQILTRHDHESTDLGRSSVVGEVQHNPPLWLIWRQDKAKDKLTHFPELDCVCDSVESAHLHYCAAMDTAPMGRVVTVERIPANHRFASSLGDWQMRAHMLLWKARAERSKREGD